jgi:hypothetical protein
VLRLPLEWEIAALTGLGVMMVVGATRLARAAERWDGLARATRRLPQVLIPTCQALVLLIPGDVVLGQMTTFLFAALGYALLASSLAGAILAHAAAWSSVGAVGLALRAAALPWEGYSLAAAALAPLYILAGRGTVRRLDRREATALEGAGLGLLVLSIVGGSATAALGYLWAGALSLALAAFVLGWCALLYRQPVGVLFAALLFMWPFQLTLNLSGLPPHAYALAYALLASLGYVPLGIALDRAGREYALPVYVTGYVLGAFGLVVSLLGCWGLYSLEMPWEGVIFLSCHDPLTLTLALAVNTALYLASAVFFGHPAWLYPGLATAHLALATQLSFAGKSLHEVTLFFLGLTWALALAGYAFTRRSSRAARRSASIGPWARPFFFFVAFDVVFWQALGLQSLETTILLAAGYAALLGLLASLWQEAALAYGALGFFLLALGCRWVQIALPWADALAWGGGLGFGLYLLACIVEQLAHRAKLKLARLAVWSEPLATVGTTLATLAVLAALPAVAAPSTASATALAFGGALYLASAYRNRHYPLGYLGMALVELAWVLTLMVREVRQPQWYAIPAGLFFIAMGTLERQRARRLFATYVESFGLSVLLLTSFAQSLDAEAGWPYFLLLLVEGLLVVWWGAARRIKVSFFIGLGASALNVAAQVVVLANVYRPLHGYEVNQWIIVLGAGLLLLTVAPLVERQRDRIIARAQGWREVLEAWE